MTDAEKTLIAALPSLEDWLARHPPWPGATHPEESPYEALLKAIVFQQLSGKAAQTILNRVIALFEPPFPTAAALLQEAPERLRSAGLSRQKIAALQDLAAKSLEGIVPQAREIAHLEDETIIERLTQVRGVGRWTVEMYLMFTLGRPDVWPVADLGVRKGAELLLGGAYPKPAALLAAGEPFRPWRSALAWHCWRATETPRSV